MTKDEFVDMCRELLELGATDIQGGIFRATFRAPMQAGPRREREPSQPPRATTPEQERQAFRDRVMGSRRGE